MRLNLSRSKIVALVVLILLVACFVDASAQNRRRRKRVSRRITNPVVYAPTPQPSPSPGASPDAQIVSEGENADQTEQPAGAQTRTNSRRTTTRAGQGESDNEATRRSVNRLSNEVRTLTDRMKQMEEQQRTLVNLERLTRAEQRAENLRAQLRDVEAKQDELQARDDQLEEALRPENIERATAVYGTARPEEVRDMRRRQLENERQRVRSQLDTLAQSRTHLESAIAAADAETERLHSLIDPTTTTDETNADTTNNTGPIMIAPVNTPSPSPTATPYANPPLSQ